MQARSEKIAEEEDKCRVMAENAQHDLDEALPALEEAMKVRRVVVVVVVVVCLIICFFFCGARGVKGWGISWLSLSSSIWFSVFLSVFIICLSSPGTRVSEQERHDRDQVVRPPPGAGGESHGSCYDPERGRADLGRGQETTW